MGKCKRRTLYKTSNSFSDASFMTREKAVSDIFNIITQKSNKNTKKHKLDFIDALNKISLFGISAEELSEAGIPYENLVALGSVIN